MNEVDQMGIVLVLFIFSIIMVCVYTRCVFALMDRDAVIRELCLEKTQLIKNVSDANELRSRDNKESTLTANRHNAAMVELRNAYDKSSQEIKSLKSYITSLQNRMQYISDCTKSNFPIPNRTNPIVHEYDDE